MTEIEKFRSDVVRTAKRVRAECVGAYDPKNACKKIQSLFERCSGVPLNLARAVAFYWQDEYIDSSSEVQNEPTEANIDRITAMLSFLHGSDEYDDCLCDEDWRELSDCVNYEAENLPIDVLQSLMGIIVSKGALS